ncbi:MAG TPA: hypothetical protein VJU13_00965 [Candidatus Nitrosocosmicus sp.]|nr:hypothetical protein [Candidatus Nitrosocosmicus sp.]
MTATATCSSLFEENNLGGTYWNSEILPDLFIVSLNKYSQTSLALSVNFSIRVEFE